MTDDRCAHCPTPAGIPCHATKARHLCDRMDPDHPRYNPAFGPSIGDISRKLAARRYPSPAQQATNLAHSLWDWATSGFSLAGDEEVARRRAICLDCEQWDDGRCRICGCFLAAKIRMKTEHCPIAKW